MQHIAPASPSAGTGRLHPSAIVTGARSGRLIGLAKRQVVRLLYNHLARAYPIAGWTTMNYGYAPLPGEDWTAPAEDRSGERFGRALYWRVATAHSNGATPAQRDILEVGSGRGGGASFLARAFPSWRVTGLDVAARAVLLASARYGDQSNLRFVQGDAEHLSFPDRTFDLVLNIESAHCYASVPRFVAEAARVLRPGGALLFAGFAARGPALHRLEAALGGSLLELRRLDDITANIVLSLRQDEARKQSLIAQTGSRLMRSFATGAYAMEGSTMRAALESGQTAYIAAVLVKPAG